MFNFLVAKDDKTDIMVDGLACKFIGTGTINIIERDGIMQGLKAVQYVPETRYNLISIRVSTKKDTGSKYNKESSELAKEIW